MKTIRVVLDVDVADEDFERYVEHYRSYGADQPTQFAINEISRSCEKVIDNNTSYLATVVEAAER